MNKHTPGPWKITADGLYIVQVGGGHVPIRTAFREGAFIGDNRTDHQESEVSANARLIAAAPDLLAALESALQTLEYLRDYHPETSGRWKHMEDIDRARAAIAKARGE